MAAAPSISDEYASATVHLRQRPAWVRSTTPSSGTFSPREVPPAPLFSWLCDSWRSAAERRATAARLQFVEVGAADRCASSRRAS